MGYAEKVRPQFLSLRQQVIDFPERIETLGICATMPDVSAGIRESSQLRARISPYFSDQRGQFSERHFASAVSRRHPHAASPPGPGVSEKVPMRRAGADCFVVAMKRV